MHLSYFLRNRIIQIEKIVSELFHEIKYAMAYDINTIKMYLHLLLIMISKNRALSVHKMEC